MLLLDPAPTNAPNDPVDGNLTVAGTYGLTNIAATLHVTGQLDWTNPSNRLDVNANGLVDPIDALIIFNELNNPRFSSSGRLVSAAGLDVFPGYFYDASADGEFVAPLDALNVINFLNKLSGSPDAERSDEFSQALPDDTSGLEAAGLEAAGLVFATAAHRDPGGVGHSLPIVGVRRPLAPSYSLVWQTVSRPSAAEARHPSHVLRGATFKSDVGNDRNTDLRKQPFDSLESVLDEIIEDVAAHWDSSGKSPRAISIKPA
jgi:hypothetical protein